MLPASVQSRSGRLALRAKWNIFKGPRAGEEEEGDALERNAEKTWIWRLLTPQAKGKPPLAVGKRKVWYPVSQRSGMEWWGRQAAPLVYSLRFLRGLSSLTLHTPLSSLL